MSEVIEIERLQMGVQIAISDTFARSLQRETFRETSLRATIHHITGWFASRKVYEETRTLTQSLGWRERIAVLFGKPVVYKMTVEMRHNCPHLAIDPERDHVRYLRGFGR